VILTVSKYLFSMPQTFGSVNRKGLFFSAKYSFSMHLVFYLITGLVERASFDRRSTN
jgi:hypothetical protein